MSGTSPASQRAGEPVDLGFEAAGDPADPTVVLLGSLGSDLSMWDAQVPRLAERFHVVRVDLRGHGRSPVPPGPYTVPELAGDVTRLLDRLGRPHAHLVGLSLGGMVAMWLAAYEPARVDRLALLATSARLGSPEDWRERAATVRAGGTEAVADAVLARWLTPAFAAASPEVAARLRAMLVATPDEGYAGCCEAIGAMDLRGDLDNVVARTLVIAGADDPATPPTHAEDIATRVAHAHVAVLQPAAHLLNVEQGDEVTRLIVEHLGR